MLALEWSVLASREATLGIAGSVITAAYDALRRVISEGAIRVVPREGRPGTAIVIELVCDGSLSPQRVSVTIPLHAGVAEGQLHTTVLEIGARIAGALGADSDPWSARVRSEDGADTSVPLAETLLSRECAARWVRALRVLPRWFPHDERGDAHYVESPAFATASELGLLGAMLVERKIPGASDEARAVVNRIQPAAEELAARARELASTLPVVLHFTEGPARDVIERTIAVAWFLHANFCCATSGPLVWAPPQMPGDPEIIVQSMDYDRFRAWIARKTGRPESVEHRVEAALRALGPRVLVEG
jgi:hypothetical protein